MNIILTLQGNPTRRQIRKRIQSQPGIHFNELVRELDLAPGQVQYHVYTLLDDDSIISSQLRGRTHYYLPEYDEWERGVLAYFRRETTREILIYLLENDGARPSEVTDTVGITRSTVEWHLSHLIEQDIIEKRRHDRGRVTLAVAHPRRTKQLLGAVEPSLPDRLVDRFTQLIDQTIGGPGDE